VAEKASLTARPTCRTNRSRRRTSASRNRRTAGRFTPSSSKFPKDGKVTIQSLATGSTNWPGKIGGVRLVGGSGGKLKFTRDETGLHVTLPEKFDGKIAFALKIQS
jgi:hypothetical protein